MNMLKRALPEPSLSGKIFVIYYVVGVLGLGLPFSRDVFTQLTPFSLLLSFAVLLLYQGRWKPAYVLSFVSIALLGFFVEVAGVLTGEVFGEYTYGKTLGLKLFNTPLMIGINWLMLIYCVHAMLENSKITGWLKVMTGAAFMVVYDVIMEPVAISLDMWSWGGGSIPLQNYVAWFMISLVFLTIMQLFGVKTQNRLAGWLFVVQTGFFLALNFIV